jgi:hypothetical protein
VQRVRRDELSRRHVAHGDAASLEFSHGDRKGLRESE